MNKNIFMTALVFAAGNNVDKDSELDDKNNGDIKNAK